MNKYIFILFTISSISLYSCNKDDSTKTEPSAEIEITTLQEGDSIAHNSMVMIHGTITGTEEMHGYKVEIRNANSDASIYSQTYGDHGTVYTIADHWTNILADTTPVKAIVKAYLDDQGAVAIKEINFTCIGL